MKPSFALTLSHGSIGLLHRTPDGWLSIGTVAQDAPDLAEALDGLRQAAADLAPQGLTTKVVIPNSEILYDHLHAPGPNPAQRRAQIAAALEGRTPYTLEELAFDWSGTGETVWVAAVARETLAEAEAFASQHGFNPVSFVAMPEPGGFAAEPWFGQTDAAPQLLAPGEKVVRDKHPIRLAPVPGDPVAEPPPEDAVAVTSEPPPPVDQAAHAQPDEAGPAPEPKAGHAGAGSGAPPTEEVAAEPESPPPAPPARAAQTELDLTPPPATQAPVLTAGAAAVAVSALIEPQIAPPPAVEAPDVEVPAADTPANADLSPPATAARTEDAPDAPVALDDIDQTQAWPGEDDGDPLGRAKAALAASLAPPPVAVAAGPAHDPDLPPPVAPTVQRALAAARATRDLPAGPTGGNAAPGLTDKVQKAIGKANRSNAKGKPKPPAPRPAMAPPPPPLPPSASQPNVPPARSEAEKMTVFGERRVRVGGKPRFLGLMLTGVLLIVLLAVAVWAAKFLDPQPQSAINTDSDAASLAALDPVMDEGTDLADLPEASAGGADAAETALTAADPEPAGEIIAETTAETIPEPAETATAPEPAAPEPAPVTVTADRATTAPTPEIAANTVEEVTLPLPDQAIEAPQRMQLAALPSGQPDPAPGTPGVLPAFGALYQFDAEGNILPTAEGVLTPDGVRLVAARPARLPPQRPASLEVPADVASVPATETPAPDSAPAVVAAPETPAAAPQETGPATTVPPGAIAIAPPATDPAFQPDPEVPGQRPPQRPVALAPASTPTPEAPAPDQGALPVQEAGDPALSQFAARRPTVRPAALIAAAAREAEAARARDIAAAAAAAAASASTALAADTSGLAATRRPAARPQNFARAVEAAVAAAVTPPVATAAAAAPAQRVAAAPDRRSNSPRIGSHPDDMFEDDEPEPTGAVASAPTRATVARQATVNGALNLGRTNLIGVFGTANARHALVRESGGRLVRVKVGDRVDGGRVVAIGASDLSYQRGGNTVRLTMPRS